VTATSASMPTLKAQNRAVAGKGEARRLRRTGFVPAIAYGKDLPATPIAVVPKEVSLILKSERGQNTVLELDLGGKKLLAMIREFALHPVKRALEHVDFIEVRLDKPVDVQVPLILRVVHRTLPVRCLPNLIPIKIEADVAHLELGQHVSTQELKLPEGVVVRLPPEQTLIAVVAPEKEEVEVVAPVVAVPGAVPAAGAPVGAPGAAPAAAAPAAEAAPAKDDKKKKK
jgi:large subunit ribosomal protein L25